MIKPRMDTRSAPGTKIVFDAGGGHENERLRAKGQLEVGKTYTVVAVYVSPEKTWSQVKIIEYAGLWFNTLLFSVKEEEKVQ